MKRALLIVLFFCIQCLKAQVGISNIDPKAQLDISATNPLAPANTDGILIPRISVFPAVNPTAVQNGMLVFLTVTAGINPPGFYYWDNSTASWKGIGNGTANHWNMTGNTGTAPPLNFIGTTDNQDLIFKRNNVVSGIVSSSNTSFGTNALPTNSGTDNVAVGVNAMSVNGSGTKNTAIGYFSFNSILNGSHNTGLGHNAGANITSGSDNIMIGSNTFGLGATVSNQLNIGNTIFGHTALKCVGINNAIPNAMLDITSANSGLLLPRIALSSTAIPGVVTNPAGGALSESTLVYNTATAGSFPNNVTPGFYYWNNFKWMRIDAENNWSKTGNMGTSPATNFIGTIDNQNLLFRRNSITAGILSDVNTSFGANSMPSNFGAGNVAVGNSALNASVTGSNNTALGNNAGSNIVNGSGNIMIGSNTVTPAFIPSDYLNIGNTIYGSIGAIKSVGINTQIPASLFHVSQGSSGGLPHTNSALTVEGNGIVYQHFLTPSNSENGILFGSEIGTIRGGIVFNNGAAPDGFQFRTGGNFTQMTLTNGGNFGIGVTIPLRRFHVAGVVGIPNIRFGSLAGTGSRFVTADFNGDLSAMTSTGASNGLFWGLTGNSGTSPATNFIGTTDDQDLIFKRNNLVSGKIANGNTFFGAGSGAVATGNLNTYIGTGAGGANISGTQNVYLGRLAGGNGNAGSDNIFIGNGAGLANTANNNVFIGSFSGNSNVTGGGNTFMGNAAGTANTGSQNTFIGTSSGSGNTTGSSNTLLGNNSSVALNNLTNATAIGTNSQVAASNSLILGSVTGINSATSSVNVGIGTTTPLTALEIVDGNVVTASATRGNLHIRSNDAQGIDRGASITLGGFNDTGATIPIVFGSVEGRKSDGTSTSSSGYLSLKVNSGGALTERLRINNTGNVGVGTPTPTSTLEVNGSFAGNIRIVAGMAFQAIDDFFIISTIAAQFQMTTLASTVSGRTLYFFARGGALTIQSAAAGVVFTPLGTSVTSNANIVLPVNTRAMFISDGTSWVRMY